MRLQACEIMKKKKNFIGFESQLFDNPFTIIHGSIILFFPNLYLALNLLSKKETPLCMVGFSGWHF